MMLLDKSGVLKISVQTLASFIFSRVNLFRCDEVPFALQAPESDTMRTLLSSIFWAVLLNSCCQTTRAEVFTSISKFKYRFNLFTIKLFVSRFKMNHMHELSLKYGSFGILQVSFLWQYV